MAFPWRADDGPTLNAGLVSLWLFRGSEPVMPRNPIIYDFFFLGGGGGLAPLSPTLDPRMSSNVIQNSFKLSPNILLSSCADEQHRPWTEQEVVKHFSCSNQLCMNSIMLINVKMLIVGILIFINQDIHHHKFERMKTLVFHHFTSSEQLKFHA